MLWSPSTPVPQIQIFHQRAAHHELAHKNATLLIPYNAQATPINPPAYFRYSCTLAGRTFPGRRAYFYSEHRYSDHIYVVFLFFWCTVISRFAMSDLECIFIGYMYLLRACTCIRGGSCTSPMSYPPRSSLVFPEWWSGVWPAPKSKPPRSSGSGSTPTTSPRADGW